MTVSLKRARGERPRSGTRQPPHCFVRRTRVGSSQLMHNLHGQPVVTFFWLLTNTDTYTQVQTHTHAVWQSISFSIQLALHYNVQFFKLAPL